MGKNGKKVELIYFWKKRKKIKMNWGKRISE